MRTKTLHGRSSAHLGLLHILRQLAHSDVEVLITGPTGVGKELYARFLHQKSQRGTAAFVPLNCGALVDTLFENELFGHVGGAFTGARQQSKGLIESAEGGTLFLDEVDSLSPASQIKLLRLLQEKEYRKLGETRLRKADVRVVAATNTRLDQAVQSGTFREDLFFRLRVAPVYVPPLRERRDDLITLSEVFVEEYAEEYHLPKISLSATAEAQVLSYGWPGNVRELENCIRYLTCLNLGRPVEPTDIPFLEDSSANTDTRQEQPAMTEQPFNEAKRSMVNQFETEYIKVVLGRCKGNVSRAARLSGKDRRAFFELMRKHNLNASDFRTTS